MPNEIKKPQPNPFIPKDLSFIKDIQSVAVVGDSPKRNFFFVRTFAASFQGTIYAINPNVTQINDLPEHSNVRFFAHLTDIPENEPVDFGFITVPRDKANQVMDDCVKKNVKLTAFFTASFADDQTDEGRRLQRELLEHAQNKVRILGPNCMGLYYPKLGIRWRSSLPLEPGNVAVVAQSGGLCNLLIHGLSAEKQYISKAFSIGNASDVNILDILKFLYDDEETRIIVCYVEGLPQSESKSGRILLDLMQYNKKKHNKPTIFLKAGRSEAGKKAATSHTASIVGDFKVFSQAIRQAGGILVESFEDVINTTIFLQSWGITQLHNMSLITLSGGYGVICSDILNDYGIKLPNFQPETKAKLAQIITNSGTSFNNPIDVAVMIYEPAKMEMVFRSILEDPAIQGIIFEMASFYIAHQMNKKSELEEEIPRIFIRLKQLTKKPLIFMTQNVGFEEVRIKLKENMRKIGIPVYSDMIHVARTLNFLNSTKI